MKKNILSNKDRRRFLKSLALMPVAGSFLGSGEARATTRVLAKLVDTTKCIGALRCKSACDNWNRLPAERTTELTGRTFMVVKRISQARNRDKISFLKWQCQHCQVPACARVCPTRAIEKLANGAVVIFEDRCIACGSCHAACPFDVPKFDFDMGVTRKCHLCFNRYTGLQYHGLKARTWSKPACVTSCPVSALDFGSREDMIRKARTRIRDVGGYLYGETEAGGTDVLTILPEKPKEMGMVSPPAELYFHPAHNFMADVAKPLIVIALGLSGLTVAGMLAQEIATTLREDSDDDQKKEG